MKKLKIKTEMLRRNGPDAHINGFTDTVVPSAVRLYMHW